METAEQPEPAGPPGEPVRWETINRSWDIDGRLVSEKITTTTETDNSPPEPERMTGFYV